MLCELIKKSQNKRKKSYYSVEEKQGWMEEIKDCLDNGKERTNDAKNKDKIKQ